jgi:hypothetical protein
MATVIRRLGVAGVVCAAFAMAVSCGVGDAELTGGGDDPLAATSEELRANWTTGPWVVFADPYLDGGANPAVNIKGVLASFDRVASTRAVLAVRDLPASHDFEAHAHVLKCGNAKGGGHYQNRADAGAGDDNELHFHFQTSLGGGGFDMSVVQWRFRDGGAQSLVVHDTVGLPDGGMKAGAKLACVDFDF